MANYATDGKLGVDIDGNATAPTSTDTGFDLGTTARVSDNRVAVYVYAGEALGSGTGVKINAAFTASVSAGAATTVLHALASGEYGWCVQTDATLNTA